MVSRPKDENSYGFGFLIKFCIWRPSQGRPRATLRALVNSGRSASAPPEVLHTPGRPRARTMPRLTAYLIAVCTALGLLPGSASPAAAYQIDCAILLCLAGGFPPSEPCAAARAEMIRRITPWPIEPPLQLWRCPMHARFPTNGAGEAPVIQAMLAPVPALDQHVEPDPFARIWHVFGEEVTDYVMAIKVYDLTYRRSRNREGDCNESGALRMGTYDRDWKFSWRRAHHTASPDWFFDTHYTNCSSVWFRGVGMEWWDHEGKKGMEVVRY